MIPCSNEAGGVSRLGGLLRLVRLLLLVRVRVGVTPVGRQLHHPLAVGPLLRLLVRALQLQCVHAAQPPRVFVWQLWLLVRPFVVVLVFLLGVPHVEHDMEPVPPLLTALLTHGPPLLPPVSVRLLRAHRPLEQGVRRPHRLQEPRFAARVLANSPLAIA